MLFSDYFVDLNIKEIVYISIVFYVFWLFCVLGFVYVWFEFILYCFLMFKLFLNIL